MFRSISSPFLVSVMVVEESPYLYQVKLTRYEGKKVADVQTLKTGIRTIAVSKDYGFQLNGVTRKLKGAWRHNW